MVPFFLNSLSLSLSPSPLFDAHTQVSFLSTATLVSSYEKTYVEGAENGHHPAVQYLTYEVLSVAREERRELNICTRMVRNLGFQLIYVMGFGSERRKSHG